MTLDSFSKVRSTTQTREYEMVKFILVVFVTTVMANSAYAVTSKNQQLDECMARVDAMMKDPRINTDPNNVLEADTRFKLYQMSVNGCRIKFG
jgi:hypothetical protein